MSFSDVATSAAQVFGFCNDKAIITFEVDPSFDPESAKDTRPPVQVLDPIQSDKGRGGLGGGLPGTGSIPNVSDLASDALSNGINGVVNAATNALQAKYSYKVKFNPSTINIRGIGGGTRKKATFGSDPDGTSGAGSTQVVTYIANDNRNVSLSVQLIFDDVEANDAFTQLYPFETSGTGSTVKAVYNAAKGTQYSVQKEVEGFIGACRDDATRKITFSWGDMSYTGTLNNVDARYTMFNPNGNPIRAVVDLTITLVQDVSHINEGTGMALFYDSYKKLFKDQKNVSLNTFANSISGIGNWGL